MKRKGLVIALLVLIVLVVGIISACNPKVTYNITFVYPDEKDNVTVSYKPSDGELELPKVPEKTGYHGFWFYDNQSFEEVKAALFDREETERNIRVYTNYLPIQYTITYDLNGGNSGPAGPDTYTIESEDITLAPAALSGYEFLGWKDQDGNILTKVVKGSHGNLTLVAQWSGTYTITYNLDGGRWPELQTGQVAPPTEYHSSSKLVIEAQPIKDNLEFIGWSGPNIEGYAYTITIAKGSSGNKTYVAHYAKYRLELELNGGEMKPGEFNPTGFDETTPTFTVKNPTKRGYSFAGWIKTGEQTGAVLELNVLKGTSENLSYYATWNLETYNITWDLKEGAFEAGGPAHTTYTVEFPDPISMPDPIREGYEFLGWTCGDDYPEPTVQALVDPLTMSGNKHFVAHWKLIEYDITYDRSNGSGYANAFMWPSGYTPKTKYSPIELPVTINLPELESHYLIFLGWDTQSSSYTIEKGTTGDLNFEAFGDPKEPFTITYELNGGSLGPNDYNPDTYTLNDLPITLANPTKNHYVFAGWTWEGQTTPIKTVKLNYGDYGDKVYTANWTARTYTITYNYNDGALPPGKTNPTTYTADTANFLLERPVLEHYEFSMWEGAPFDPEALDTFNVALILEDLADGEANVTLFAMYQPKYRIILQNLGGVETLPNEIFYDEATGTFYMTYNVETGVTLPSEINDKIVGEHSYVFGGWTGEGITWPPTKNVTIPPGTTGDKTYTANFIG